jgi:methionyl-tRNA synthetase
MKKYLIIPAMPTPNGPLHLGHIGGPYLRADILARYLRQQGHQVTILSGTDNFENFTERQAVKEKCSPRDICMKYYPQILADLKTMNIMLDDFINPLDDQWVDVYHSWCAKLLGQAVSSGKAIFENDDCLLDLPRNTNLNNSGISTALISAYHKYITVNNYSTILTSSSDWGFKINEHKTMLSYGFIFAYYLLLGEIAGRHAQKNGFDKNSETTIIATFGVDNTIPILSSVSGFSSISETFKPVDYYIINYFYHMNGKKLSTSSRHAIWVRDINQKNISVDVLRLFLASIDVSSSVGDFSLDDYLHFQTEMEADIASWMLYPVMPVRAPHPDSAELYALVNEALQPAQFKPHLAVQAIQEWMSRGTSIDFQTEEYSAWLQALGTAVYPFMPELAQKIFVMTGEQTRCVNMI